MTIESRQLSPEEILMLKYHIGEIALSLVPKAKAVGHVRARDTMIYWQPQPEGDFMLFLAVFVHARLSRQHFR